MELPRNFAARHAEQWTSWLRESSPCHACVALFTEIFESFGDRSDFKDSIRRVFWMNGPFQRLTSQAIAKIMKGPRKGIKNFSIWERKQIYHRFVNGLSKAQEGWRGLYLPLSISPSPFVSLEIKIWFKFSDNSRFRSAAAAELAAGSCGNEKGIDLNANGDWQSNPRAICI